ncbi:unnamed protein product [Owenia fusiformis]|nr:unnamed protein product [Owenia fusiformis]
MDHTGGGYMSQPLTNSEAMRRCMTIPAAPPSSQLRYTRDPYPPYATAAAPVRSWSRRPASAPTRRAAAPSNSLPWRQNNYVSPRRQKTYSVGLASSSRIRDDFSIHTPWQARKIESWINSTLGYPQADSGRQCQLSAYDPLNDPHLQDYYTKKFSSIPRPPSGRPRARSPSGKRGMKSPRGKMSRKGKEDILYKIAVTTGDKKNCGTDARVFIRLKGSKGKLPKKQLIKKSGSTKKNVGFRFAKGTTHVFKVRGQELGDLVSMVIEHDGLAEKDSWYLEEVEVVNTSTKKSWLFHCQQWLSLHKGDGQMSRELYAKKHSKTEYRIVTVTGGMKGSGTDANVFLTLYGKSGHTQKISLKNNSKDVFEKNQSDEFFAKSTCVGPMTKIRIEHDNTGFAAGWYLERVVVTDMKNPKWTYYFPCGQWLSKSEGDGAISRDLIGSKDPLAIRRANKYKVTVYTADKRGAGTDANVYITMFGETGDSGERRLDTSKNNFEKGTVDEFIIESPCLGALKRVRIGHDNSGMGPGWFLDKVIVDDMDQNRVYDFPCNRWLADDEDDGHISRDLLCNIGPMDSEPGIPYEIQVTTSDIRHSSTSARVYVVLYGPGGEKNSGKVWLDGGKFDRGKTDIFNVEVAENLSPLSKIDVGHDNSGSGAGWHLKKVSINCQSAGFEQHFLCDKWLAVDEGEGLIERTLKETLSLRKKRKKKTTWTAFIHTSDIRGAGTDANVFIVVYGDKGKSDDIYLDNKSDNFESGQLDKFKIEMIDIGKPYKMRIGHDDSGSFAGWHLDKVELENMSNQDRYVFNCDRWLATDEDDGSCVREMPAEGPGIKKPLPLVKYTAEVHTGKKRGAGTDANVFLCVYGELGDTGDRQLTQSKTNTNKFEKGNVDEFEFEAVTLKKFDKIRVGHDGNNAGAGWYLDKVVIREEGNSKNVKTFECNRWLAIDEDDGLIVREITSGGSQMLSTTSYHVSVKTGDIRSGGTDANVYVKIFGKNGDTGILYLKSSDNTKNKFERGRTDLFKLEATDIGKIERIRIGHEDNGVGAGWFLDEVRVDVPSKGEHYLFACHRWLDKSEGDGEIEVELEPTEVRKGDKDIPYEVTVWTSDIRGAGTDANVFIQMYGENGKTEQYDIQNRTDNFEQGQVEKFKIEATDIGPLLKIRVGHDGKGMFAGWHLEKILIQRHPTKASKRRKWTNKKNKGKKKLKKSDESEDSDKENYKSRNKRRSKRDDSDYDSDDSSRRSSRRSRSSREENKNGRRKSRSGSRYSDDDLESSISNRNRRKSKSFSRYSDEEDRKSIKSIKNRRRSKSQYSSDEDEKHSKKNQKNRRSRSRYSDEDSMSDDDSRNKKKKNYQRKFDDKERRKSRDDEKDDKDEDIEEYWFVCNHWFAKGEDDGKIVRELLPTDEDGNPLDTGLEEIEYKVNVTTGDVWGAGTDAVVFINISGEHGDTGERELQDSNNINKYERNQTDEFVIKAVELGELKRLRIRHDNAGGGAAWFLGHVEVEDPKSKKKWFFPCQRWLATDEDDGQIARDLVPVDMSLKKKLSRQDSMAIRKEIALETKAAMTTYHVYVTTSDIWGAGTDANVYVVLFGELDDTGQMFLKTSKTNRDKFERKQTDEFIIEAVEIGDLKKIKIGHDNKGGGGAWHLEKVEIDAPSLGKKWTFPCGRWLAKDEDDGLLERELYPQELATEQYIPCIPYEITTYTSDRSGSSTDADVYIVIYGKDQCSEKKSLCANKKERKSSFERGAEDKFVIELEDVGDPIEKIRIGHDASGWGSGWHLNRVEMRKLHESGKGSTTYVFPCDRWLARDEEDGAIERELVAGKILEETMKKDGTVKKKQIERKDTLISKKYNVNVYTGDIRGAGTDANVFLTIFGEKGDTGERKLVKSETNRDKFERNQVDKFTMEAVDLGKLFKVKIRHDNSMLSPAWYLDKVEVIDSNDDNETYVFHCERWLGKNKDDGKIERSLYVKGYEGDMASTSTLRSNLKIGSMTSLDSMRSEPFSKSPRMNRKQSIIEELPEGPTIPYTVRVHTGAGDDNGTDANAWIQIYGQKKKLTTGKLYLELAQREKFLPSSIETFSLEAVDVDEIKSIEIGHDGVIPGTGWFIKEVDIDMPTKGKHYFLPCKQWLARDKGDGRTSRTINVQDGDGTTTSYKPMVPYEVTVHTGDESGAGTDAQIFIKVFGANGNTDDIMLEKKSERFERAKADLIKLELDDIAPLKKLRVGHDGKGTRPDWYLDKVELRNMDTGDLTVFKAGCWLSKTKGDNKLVKDLPALVRGKKQVKTTSYKVNVKTSDVRGAGTDANVYCILFGENGDSGELHLKSSETFKDPFENQQVDVFTFPDMLSLGELCKVRIWHDNKGFGAAWHLAHVEVEDVSGKKKFMFPCNRWLSKSEDDKQIIRELTCANLSAPSPKDKISYEIEVTTSDKANAGMVHNGWLQLEGKLEGKKKTSKEFVMENSAKKKILRKGQTDSFKFSSKNLGKLQRCILGAVERDDKSLGDVSGKEAMWHCHEVTVTDTSCGDKYVFPCKDWISIMPEMDEDDAKSLEVKDVEQGKLNTIRSLAPIKYEVIVITGDIKGAGTDANVHLTIFGTNGDTGKRPLTQRFRDLFERNQTDKFTLECLDLGELTKLKIEHDDKGWGAGWFLDRVEVINMATNKTTTFPCEQWLDKKKGDGEICRELFPRD